MDNAKRIIIQTNDYFSWDVERVGGEDQIFNGILFLMKEHSISENEAKERLRISVVQDERTYLSMLNRFYTSHPSPPKHLQNYIAAVSHLVGGNHHWSAACPRYKLQTESLGKRVLESRIKTKSAVRDSLGSTDTRVTDQHIPDSVSIVRSIDEKGHLDDTALLGPHATYNHSHPKTSV